MLNDMMQLAAGQDVQLLLSPQIDENWEVYTVNSEPFFKTKTLVVAKCRRRLSPR